MLPKAVLPDVSAATVSTHAPAGHRARRLLRWGMIVAAAATVAACDRQNQTNPQDSAQSAATSVSSPPPSEAPAGQRYRVDRSHVGAAIPDTQLTDPTDKPAALTSLRGKPLVVNLWATWCAPCIEELPTLQTIATEGKDRYHVIALSQDLQEAPAPRQFLTERGFTALSAWHDPDNTLGVAYGQALPTTLLFNAKGEEVLRVIGPLDWAGPVGRALLAEAGIAPNP